MSDVDKWCFNRDDGLSMPSALLLDVRTYFLYEIYNDGFLWYIEIGGMKVRMVMWCDGWVVKAILGLCTG